MLNNNQLLMHVSKLLYSSRHFIAPVGTKTFKRKIILNDLLPTVAYNTILDIEKYKEYIPYCSESEILTRSPINGFPEKGRLKVDFQKYTIEFTCDIDCKKTETLKACTAFITEEHKESSQLFEYLSTKWQVNPVNINANDNNAFLKNDIIFKGLKLNDNSSKIIEKTPNNKICEVNLELSFKFKSKILQSISILFGEATMTIIMNGFKRRMVHLNKLSIKKNN